MLVLLLACDSLGGASAGGIDTTDLFPVEEGLFAAYRHSTATEFAAMDPMTEVDESDLALSLYSQDGCASGDGWRAEFRHGESWATAEALGAIHFDTDGGLAICGYSSASGDLSSYDPAIQLWADGTPLEDEGEVASGDWTVGALRQRDVATYFGIFPETASFTIAGPGEMDGWLLHLSARYGLVLFVNPEFTGDLVYSR